MQRGIVAATTQQKIVQSAGALVRQLGASWSAPARGRQRKVGTSPRGVRFIDGIASLPPDDRCAKAPSSPQAQGADDGQGASPPPERRPFCAKAQAELELKAHKQR